jgi:hypothetical protein
LLAFEDEDILQGLPALGFDGEAMRGILMEVAELASYSSIVMGELPQMARAQAEDLLGEAGLLGTLRSGESFKSSGSASRLACWDAHTPVVGFAT